MLATGAVDAYQGLWASLELPVEGSPLASQQAHAGSTQPAWLEGPLMWILLLPKGEGVLLQAGRSSLLRHHHICHGWPGRAHHDGGARQERQLAGLREFVVVIVVIISV